MLLSDVTFEAFARTGGVRVRAGLVAAYGPDVGHDAASEALAYGWEHWDRLSTMNNPAGYLFRVGQSAARRARRPQGFLPVPEGPQIPEIEPGLLPAIEALTEPQRVCVVMVHGYGWTFNEVAELLGISVSTARTHVARALSHLHQCLEAAPHVD